MGKVGRVVVDVHRHHHALGRLGPGDLHLGDPQPVDLVGQRHRCQLIPRGERRGEVAHPAVQGQGSHTTRTGVSDSTASPRRHQRVPGQPSNSTAAARPLIAIHSHSVVGAGSPATPSDVMYQYESGGHRGGGDQRHGQHPLEPAPRTPLDRDDQHQQRQSLHGRRKPAVQQGQSSEELVQRSLPLLSRSLRGADPWSFRARVGRNNYPTPAPPVRLPSWRVGVAI